MHSQVVLVAGMKSRLDYKSAILAPYTQWGAKLCGSSVCFYHIKQAFAHHDDKQLRPDVHEVHSPPFIWVREFPTFWHWHNLALMPLHKVEPILLEFQDEVKQVE